MRDLSEMGDLCKRICEYAAGTGEATVIRVTEDLMYQIALAASVVSAKRTADDSIGAVKGLMEELIRAMEKRGDGE